MSDLAEFLLARITEDEDRARTFLAENHAALVRAGSLFRETAMSFIVRVLAECEAKQRIVEVHPQTVDRDRFCAADSEQSPCPTLRLLALPYADHPDYDEAWRP